MKLKLELGAERLQNDKSVGLLLERYNFTTFEMEGKYSTDWSLNLYLWFFILWIGIPSEELP